jgi:hypothetical protein
VSDASFELVEVLPDDLTFASTATGPIGLEPAYMSTALPDIAWLGLQELHQHSLGLPGGDSFFAHGAQELTPDQAYGLWSAGTIGVLGQINVTDPVAADRLLGSLTGFAGAHGSLDGLESPFLSAFNSAMRDPLSSSLNPAGDMWQEVGIPGQLGGGAQTAPIINPATGQLVLPSHQQLADCVGPNAPSPSPTSLSSLIDAGLSLGTAKLAEGMRDLFAGPHPGITASGQPSAIATTDYSKVANALVAWGAGTVAAGLAAGPLAAVGAFIVGLFNFLTALGSSGDPPAAVQPPGPDSQGKQAAEGKCVVVAQTPVTTKQGAPTAMDKNGTPHPTGPASPAPSGTPASSGTSPPPEKKVPTPSEPAKCWRDEDGSLNSEFVVPYWQNAIVMSPAFIPVGPGLDAFVMNVRADVAHLAAVPTLDAAGEVETASFLASALVSSRIPTGVG